MARLSGAASPQRERERGGGGGEGGREMGDTNRGRQG